MSSFLFFPRYAPCADCGAAVDRSALDEHVCDPERRLDFQLLLVRSEVDGFERELATWLASTHGRFEQYYAARERAASSSRSLAA
jgi:hypothetical protein